ncbi:UNVERIFIED_CONTAM: aprD [Trichonephila clavipes]
MMIAASILAGRALAPVELIISTWKQFSAARTAYARLNELLARFPARSAGMPLPRPSGELRVEQVTGAPPGSPAAIIRSVSLLARPGQLLTIIGPSASGKSTLVRLLVGIWQPAHGHVRLDGADISRWDRAELGPWIGYLPQDVELFSGTVAENIARFGDVDSDSVIAAARKAGMHDAILRLPDGYDTQIGEGGSTLSGGQRQRIALARALYGDPSLIVLDEPNANLDEAGENALLQAICQAREENRTVILVTHRTRIIQATDQLLVLQDGMARLQGPREKVLDALRASDPR